MWDRAPLSADELQGNARAVNRPSISSLEELVMTDKQAKCTVFYGVDVSKASLSIACHGAAQRWQIDNELSAIEQWLHHLPPSAGIAMEATGTFHELLAVLAHTRAVAVFVLNPKLVHHYAKGVGQRGKTDPVDAALIARYLANEHAHLHAWRPPAPQLQQLAKLLSRRAQLVEAGQRLNLSLSGLDILKKILQTVRNTFKRTIRGVDLMIAKVIAKHQELASLHARLKTIPGVGELVAAQLCLALCRWSFRSSDAFVAYTGLDPRPDDSGTRRGRRKLSKHGSSALRRVLYMAAMAASCPTRAFAPQYQKLREQNFASTEAYVIIARKITRIAFALFKSNQHFDPQQILRNA
jgi:transposase